MNHNDRRAFADLCDELAVVFDKELAPGLLEAYWAELRDYSLSVVEEAAHELKRADKYFPRISRWLEECRRVAARRAAKATKRERPAHAEPMTWAGIATAILVQVRIRGAEHALNDERTRDRALTLINDELRTLRELYAKPADCPRPEYLSERARIIRVVLDALRAPDHEREAAAPPVREASS